MWAYGINKDHLTQLQKTPLSERTPSQGIIRLDVELPRLQEDEVLIKVKASALNYNSIWSSLAYPLTPFQLLSNHVSRNPSAQDHLQDYAIFGSDASGIIEELGKGVKNWKVGDEVIVHCNVVDLNEPILQQDGMLPMSQSIWGYETNFGAFAQYSKVKASQLISKPKHIAWDVASSFSLTLSTAYRMLISINGANLRSGQNCLIWGASGGLGNFAIQLVKLAGANAIAVVSSKEKEKLCYDLGADVVINRSEEDFSDFILPDGNPNYLNWKKAQMLLKKKGINGVDVVFEHVGRDTLGVSLFLLNRGGKIVTCAASSGYNATIDLRYLWMSLKRIIGSHFANYHEATKAAELVFQNKICPLIHSVNDIADVGSLMNEMQSSKTFGKIVFKH